MDNIYIRFGTKLYRQIVGFPMYANCAPLVVDLFLFCYERDFMKDLSNDNRPILLRLSTQRLDISTIFSTLTLQGQLLKGAKCHIYLYCFTFVYIDLKKAFVIIVLFPQKNIAVRKCVQMVKESEMI